MRRRFIYLGGLLAWLFSGFVFAATAPSTYSAYTGTDIKPVPPAPSLGPANSFIKDPTFGSRILRVTDPNTSSGDSFIPTEAGVHRTWNADSTAFKLTTSGNSSLWMEFNPSTFKVGDGSATPKPHPLSINANWEWSTVNPDVIYFLNGNQIASYNKATGVTKNLAGPPTGEPVVSYAVVVGADNWVCSAAGAGIQDSFQKIFCVNPSNTSQTVFIDAPNQTINGVAQSDPNWPTAASGQTLGIHSIDGGGGAGASWLEVDFHQQSWGANGDSVFNLATQKWSLLTNGDFYWSGHLCLGNGRLANAAGSQDGRDSRGFVSRDPSDLMNASKYTFFMQPQTTQNWNDEDHCSWFNAASNPSAPVLSSRVVEQASAPWLTWYGEIVAAATDGSNTVWRFAHNHSGPVSVPTGTNYYTEGFAQISNDGRWALFSSYWDGTLGASTGNQFEISTRIDTFIVELVPSSTNPPPPCDLNGDGSTNVNDVQLCVNQAIGISACIPHGQPGSGDINQDGVCNVIDVQRVANAAMGGACVSP